MLFILPPSQLELGPYVQTSLGKLAQGHRPRPYYRTAFSNEPTLAAYGLARVGRGLAVLDWPAERALICPYIWLPHLCTDWIPDSSSPPLEVPLAAAG